jgi:benzoylformate decarboxylase/acetolactate synthase-1/2/3 large subunit
MERARTDASYAWDAVPISTGRLAAEVWAQIRTEDWSLVNGALSGWPQRLFNFEKYYQYIGVSGGSGIGYGCARGRRRGAGQQEIRTSLGEPAERRRPHVRARRALDRGASPHSDSLRDEQQPRVPRRGHASRADGGTAASAGSTARIVGNTLDDPGIDFAKLAQSMGVHA